jgi:hypothetical protein
MKRLLPGIGVLLVLLLAVKAFIYPIEPTNIGFAWNLFTGEMQIKDRAGFHIDMPWVWVAHVDIKPMRVCITSSAHAAVNCKLVQFDPSHYKEFLAVEGWRWYWWSNRFSFNSGYSDEYRGFRDVIRGYAFSAQPYSFIKVLGEYQ